LKKKKSFPAKEQKKFKIKENKMVFCCVVFYFLKRKNGFFIIYLFLSDKSVVLGLDFSSTSRDRILGDVLCRVPCQTQAVGFFIFWNQMEVNVENGLIRDGAIVLQNVVVFDSGSASDTVDDSSNVGARIFGKLVILLGVFFGDHKAVAFGERTDVHEREGFVGFGDFDARDLALDDFAEDARIGHFLFVFLCVEN
jgi:hypothetical protein